MGSETVSRSNGLFEHVAIEGSGPEWVFLRTESPILYVLARARRTAKVCLSSNARSDQVQRINEGSVVLNLYY